MFTQLMFVVNYSQFGVQCLFEKVQFNWRAYLRKKFPSRDLEPWNQYDESMENQT